MSVMASQITANKTVCSTACSCWHQRKHESSVLHWNENSDSDEIFVSGCPWKMAIKTAAFSFQCTRPFARGIHRWSLDSLHKGSVMRSATHVCVCVCVCVWGGGGGLTSIITDSGDVIRPFLCLCWAMRSLRDDFKIWRELFSFVWYEWFKRYFHWSDHFMENG